MSKRILENPVLPPDKRLRNDVDNLINIFGNISLSAKCSMRSNDISRTINLRDDSKELLQSVLFSDVKCLKTSSMDTVVQKLQIELVRLHLLKISDKDARKLFMDISVILGKIKLNTKDNERFNNLESYTRNETAYRQVQLFSDQYFVSKHKNKTNETSSNEKKLLEDSPICEKEVNIEIRQIITCISQLARKSTIFAEQLLTQRVNISHEQSDNLETAIEILHDITNSYIKDTRFTKKNYGLILALTHLLCSLTGHYGKFSEIEKVDESLQLLFVSVLRLANYDIDIILNLSESFVNIAKHDGRLKLLTSMCICHIAKHPEYSRTFKLHQIEMSGCTFQIFFMLLSHVSRLYEHERVKQVNDLKALIQITDNLNFLTHIILANATDINFFKVSVRNSNCHCYRYLLMSSLILNNMILRNQNSDPDYSKAMVSTSKSGIIMLNGIFSYMKNSSIFWNIKFPIMNEIYILMKTNKPVRYNGSRTKAICDYTADSGDPFYEYFIEKFNVDPVSTEDSDDQNNKKCRPAKERKLVLEETTKEDLLKELYDDFNRDELVFGFGSQRNVD